MVEITHKKPRFPLETRLPEPFFERRFWPFSRSIHPWFRADPWEEMEKAWSAYQDYLDRAFRDLPDSLKKFTVDITCDLADKGDKFVLTADLPGMNKDEVKINVTDNEIEISAEHKESKEEKKKGYIREERSQVRYERTLSVPEEVVGSKVTAKMQDGILTLELPKKVPTKIESPVSVKVE